jgi:hypothetical protein
MSWHSNITNNCFGQKDMSSLIACMIYGFEITRMILLQASYLYICTLLRWVTFEVLSLNSYVLGPTLALSV